MIGFFEPSLLFSSLPLSHFSVFPLILFVISSPFCFSLLTSARLFLCSPQNPPCSIFDSNSYPPGETSPYATRAMNSAQLSSLSRKDVIFSAASPDEGALVSAAAYFGFFFVKREVDALLVLSRPMKRENEGDNPIHKNNRKNDKNDKSGKNDKSDLKKQTMKERAESKMETHGETRGTLLRYELLHTLDFTSTRKRSSVIVREPNEMGGRVILYSKGADNVMKQRLGRKKGAGEREREEKTAQQVDEMAQVGLRTLLVCKRVLSKEEYERWAKRYD